MKLKNRPQNGEHAALRLQIAAIEGFEEQMLVLEARFVVELMMIDVMMS